MAYIDREKAIEDLKSQKFKIMALDSHRQFNRFINTIIEYLKDLPTADVAEVKHGYWVEDGSGEKLPLNDEGDTQKSCRCSNCDDWLTASDEYPCRGYYCPTCGAKMEVQNEHEHR